MLLPLREPSLMSISVWNSTVERKGAVADSLQAPSAMLIMERSVSLPPMHLWQSSSRLVDHPHSCHYETTSRAGLCKVPRLWRHRQSSGRKKERYHHLYRTYRIRNHQSTLLSRRLPWSRRLYQEHDHWSCKYGRCCHRRRRGRWPDVRWEQRHFSQHD